MNGEEMAMVDLNADPGDGETPISSDLAILNCATSVNPSFGLHAGNQRVIRDSAIAATEYGVVIGAQVSFRFHLTGEHRGSRIATVDA
jgi:UPF0271 protein